MAVKRGGLHSVSDLVWIWQITHLTLARGDLLRGIDKKTVNNQISICLLMTFPLHQLKPNSKTQ